MQIRRSSFPPDVDLPPCPFDHEKKPCLHRHGYYERYSQPEGSAKTPIARFFCTLTGRTLSVLLDTFFPYRPIEVDAVEAHFDQLSETEKPRTEDARIDDEAQDNAPAPSERRRDSLLRAWLRFCSSSRIESLKAFFGQRLPLTNSVRELWSAMRQTGGSLRQILLDLAEEGRSLFGDYQCLRAD